MEGCAEHRKTQLCETLHKALLPISWPSSSIIFSYKNGHHFDLAWISLSFFLFCYVLFCLLKKGSICIDISKDAISTVQSLLGA
jgi:hypothetical protein